MCFIYVYTEWKGSAHNACVLESVLRMHTDFPVPSPGSNSALISCAKHHQVALFSISNSIDLKNIVFQFLSM